MGILEEIREYFASTQNGAREIKTLPKEYSAMVIRDNEGYGVAIEFDDIRDISEKFANSRLFSRTLAIGGIEKKYLILSCMLDSLRYEFATVCAQFVEPGIDGMDRKNLMSEPLEWWKKWRELMGNTISNKEAYSVIAEMMVLDDLYTQDNTVEWTAVNSGSHDIEGNESSYEVKSTVKRYGATITISGQHQLQSLKRLQLYFCRLEQSRTGISINDMKDRLVADGYDKDKIEQQLYQLGYERGASIREEKYKVLEKRKYEVDDTFPKITKASFKDDHIPESITQLHIPLIWMAWNILYGDPGRKEMFRVIETFSGIGSQAKALTRIGKPFEIVNTADWDINAILAYCLIHKGKIDINKYADISDEDVTNFLKGLSLSSDGKKPMSDEAFRRMPMHLKRRLYAAIKETRNMVSITDVMGSDIPDNIDLFTYSFPCQDLSLCGCWHGNKSGIARDAHNRSGMLWEVERILLEMNEMGKELPRFLLMENVTNILSKPHAADFGDWKETLENLGYYNKIYRLNAQNFGIPQKRERAYMISILCKNNAETIAQVEKYFEEHNLEKDEATRLKQRNLRLKDILCLDYDDVPRYKEEADASKPNDTPSRRKIWEDNELLYDGKEIRDIVVNTVTTKQDRNPNSGLIIYKNRARGKTKWRYLTPRECFKLMGFDESDFDRIISDNPMVTKNRYLYSTEKLIKLAGNSIVVDVLEAIFRQIMDINGKILGERK